MQEFRPRATRRVGARREATARQRQKRTAVTLLVQAKRNVHGGQAAADQ